MILSHFKPKVPQPQTATDYIKTNLEVLTKDIHPMDQIELHKQTGEMAYATLADKAMLAHQLKESLKNTSTQLDLEKMSSFAKDNRIKTLEEIIVDLGHDPKDAKCWVWSLIIFYSTATLDPSSKWGDNAARKIIAARGVQRGRQRLLGAPPAVGFGGNAPEAKNSCKIAL